jgi:hypothetical protein
MAASRAFTSLLAVTVLVLVSSTMPRVMASDPGPLQDFCVADLMNPGIYITPFSFFHIMYLDSLKQCIDVTLAERLSISKPVNCIGC